MSMRTTLNVAMTTTATVLASTQCHGADFVADVDNTGVITVYETGTSTVVDELAAGDSFSLTNVGNLNNYDAKSSVASGDKLIIRTVLI